MGGDIIMPYATHPDLARQRDGNPRTGTRDLAGLVFRALRGGYDLHMLGCVYVAVPEGTPVFAGESISEIIGGISGAAVRDRGHSGTGWPAGYSR